eukprot:scaffold278330_cov28-Tisochrysis_lutea.AAC.1
MYVKGFRTWLQHGRKVWALGSNCSPARPRKTLTHASQELRHRCKVSATYAAEKYRGGHFVRASPSRTQRRPMRSEWKAPVDEQVEVVKFWNG